MPVFHRYSGIDYSGAVTPKSNCKGLRVYVRLRDFIEKKAVTME